MPIYPATITRTRETLEQLATTAATEYRAWDAQLQAARTFSDPNFSEKGNDAERQRRYDAAKAAAASSAAQLRQTSQTEREYVLRVLDENRPHITDWAQAQAKWSQARGYLDNGHSLAHVLRSADEAMTLAVEDSGPHWLRAQTEPAQLVSLHYDASGSDPVGASVQQLQRMVLLRLAELATDPALADLYRLAVQLDSFTAAAAPWIDGLDAVAAGRTFNQLTAAANSRLLNQAAASQLQLLSPQQTATVSA